MAPGWLGNFIGETKKLGAGEKARRGRRSCEAKPRQGEGAGEDSIPSRLPWEMAAAYIRRAIGIDQPEFSDDINEPLFRDTRGAKRQPVQDITGKVRMAVRKNGVVMAAFLSALCLGANHSGHSRRAHLRTLRLVAPFMTRGHAATNLILCFSTWSPHPCHFPWVQDSFPFPCWAVLCTRGGSGRAAEMYRATVAGRQGTGERRLCRVGWARGGTLR